MWPSLFFRIRQRNNPREATQHVTRMRRRAHRAQQRLRVETFVIDRFRTRTQIAAHLAHTEFRMKLHAPRIRRKAHSLVIVET